MVELLLRYMVDRVPYFNVRVIRYENGMLAL